MSPQDRHHQAFFTETLGRGVGRAAMDELQRRFDQFVEGIGGCVPKTRDVKSLKAVHRIVRCVEKELSRLPVGMVAAHRYVEHRRRGRVDLLLWIRSEVARGEQEVLEPTLTLSYLSFPFAIGEIHTQALFSLSHHAVARFCQFNRLLDHLTLLPALAEVSRSAFWVLVMPSNASFLLPCGPGVFLCETGDETTSLGQKKEENIRALARTWLRDRDYVRHGKLIGHWRNATVPKLGDANIALSNLSQFFDAYKRSSVLQGEPT